MWPLDRAKSDSLWASTSRSRRGLAQRATARPDGGHGLDSRSSVASSSSREVGDDDVGAVVAQRIGAGRRGRRRPPRRTRRPAGLDAGQRVLEDRRLRRARRPVRGRGQERVGRRFAGAGAARPPRPVDAGVEEVLDAGRGAAPPRCWRWRRPPRCAGRRPRGAHEAAPTLEHPDRPRRGAPGPGRSCGCRGRARSRVRGDRTGVALGQGDVAGRQERPGALRPGAGRRRGARSRAPPNGTNGSPLRRPGADRKSSNICFQAAACTLAVSVSTPSRSKGRSSRSPVGHAPRSPPSFVVRRSSFVFVVRVRRSSRSGRRPLVEDAAPPSPGDYTSTGSGNPT